MYIAKIAVSKLSLENDILYSYEIPENFVNEIKIGCRVIVPFGKGSAKRLGLVMELAKECENKPATPLKKIYIVLDKTPLISSEMMAVIKWVKERYFCSYFDAAKQVFPHGLGDSLSGIKYRINENSLGDKNALDEPQKAFFEALSGRSKKVFTLKDIINLKIKNYNRVLNSCIDKGLLVEEFENPKNACERTNNYFEINNNFSCPLPHFTEKQKKIYDYIKTNKSATMKEICYFTGVSPATVRNLFSKGILSVSKKTEYVSPEDSREASSYDKSKISELTPTQEKAFDIAKEMFLKNRFDVALLYGVTGSGKTEVLLNLVDLALSLNKGTIFMMPEIALTSQFIEVFKSRYQNDVAVIHSGLSDKERFHNWKLINEGKCKVVLGTRSAVFAPVKNLGLIIIDEEHEATYKSENTPRFSAKDVAKFRCKSSGSLLILSSATPAVESYYNAKIGKYKLIEIKERYSGALLPKMDIVDMNSSRLSDKSSEFSEELANALIDNFKNKKQSIIFINRRGYNTLAKCSSCGEVLSCPNCSISLNYHKSNGKLMCHYCGFSKDFSENCPKCRKNSVKFLGFGTQKIEEVLHKIVPEAKVLRMDLDTKNVKKSAKDMLKDFAGGKYDILVGTQMISKGFNFSRVTLVGVLSVDQYLYSSDFKSYERTYSLLTQVSGRSGRSKFPGRAIIQTFSPESEIFRFVKSQNYEDFFEHEISIRKAMLYPPFADICVIGFTFENEKRAYKAGLQFFKTLTSTAKQKYGNIPLRIFPISEALIKKISGKYRYRIIIKCKNNSAFRNLISESIKVFSKDSVCRNVPMFVDINPDMIL